MAKLKLRYEAEVDINGVPKFDDREKMIEDLKQFKLKRVVFEIYRFVKKRSNPQNAYYWSVVVPILMDGFKGVGHFDLTTSASVHNWMKATYLRDIVESEIEGVESLQTIRSTSDLNSIEFYDIMEELQRFGAEFLGVNIPDPDPNWRNREHESYSDKIRL